MKKHLYAVLGILLMASCQEKDDLSPVVGVNEKTSNENPFAISEEEALANLEAFLAGSEEAETRGLSVKSVSSIVPIKYNMAMTKAGGSDVNCENLLYVANFEQEQGYAILAADNRIGDKVIAVADSGCMSDATIYTAAELMNSERVIYEGYPTTGPGFFTLPETGDELFMNPNTVSLYDADEDDTYVGNFEEDDETDTPTKGVQGKNISTPEFISGSLCVGYAVNELVEFGKGKDNFTPATGDGLESEVTTRSAWTVANNVEPILSLYKYWRQDKPFNNLCPERRFLLLFSKKKKTLAGCFPLAISKIMAHFEHPGSFVYNGYEVNWKELKRSCDSEIGGRSAAALLKGIGLDCHSLYFYFGTFTFPKKVVNFMKGIGFKNVHRRSYSFDRVKEMLDKDCPLIIYSIPGINLVKSHSWNIDGYKIKERTVKTDVYSGMWLKETKTRKETCKMVHCDFGWQGKCNGYYVSGVFKLNDPNIEHDSGWYGGSTHYNNLLKVITYDRP